MNLITGATGHIGNALVRAMLAIGERVRALVLPGEKIDCLEGLDVEVVTGDVLQEDTLTAAFSGVRDVYHLAGMISILPGRDPLVEKVNILGTQNVVRAALQARVRRLVYTSSIHAIRRAPQGTQIDESVPFDPLNALSSYDRSKAIATLTVLAAVPQGLDAVVVCPTGVIGPYDYRLSEMGRLICDCLQNKPQFYVDGAYDFVDVRDVADGLIRAGSRGCCGQTYILSGERITVRRLLEIVREVSGARFAMWRLPYGLARLIARLAPFHYRLWRLRPRITPYSLETLKSNSWISYLKAHRELGYSPRRLRDSLADTVEWLRQYQKRLSGAF